MIVRVYRILSAVFLLVAIIGSFAIPRRNLRTTGQVAGIALDWEEEQIKASFELYVPALDETIGKESKTVVGYGSSLEECIVNATRTNGDDLFVNDASALIVAGEYDEYLLNHVFEYFCSLKNTHMDLPVFFTLGQNAEQIFAEEGSVISISLAASAKSLKQTQTLKNLMNGVGKRILIEGKGGYEIIS